VDVCLLWVLYVVP